MTDTDQRIVAIRRWLAGPVGWSVVRFEPASADASFRRYFRIWRADGATRIVMDAPPDKEDTAPYCRTTQILAACGVHVPTIEAADATLGLLLLEDLGSTPLLSQLQGGGDVDALYGEALAALALIQLRGGGSLRQLPPYDAATLGREMQLLPEWFCARHLRIELSAAEHEMLQSSFAFLIREALSQPVVLVHRDYHSRNLMITPERSPGIIDFQDAVSGPLGYDLVSLLKDCYIAWPRARVLGWLEKYREQLLGEGFSAAADAGEFLRGFDLIGVQRHIKVLGIFARLWYRDGKRGYLADLPRVLAYVREAASLYVELAPFHAWLEQRVTPALAAANERELRGSAA
ncbi:MAG: phosphotransferase [Steroidobacteraceae bacterium]|jgi:aminoglycoside/choline kinase family phosphotransferase